MVTSVHGVSEYVGLSTDTKPTDDVGNGDKFLEMDTGLEFRFNVEDSEWVQFPPAAGGEE